MQYRIRQGEDVRKQKNRTANGNSSIDDDLPTFLPFSCLNTSYSNTFFFSFFRLSWLALSRTCHTLAIFFLFFWILAKWIPSHCTAPFSSCWILCGKKKKKRKEKTKRNGNKDRHVFDPNRLIVKHRTVSATCDGKTGREREMKDAKQSPSQMTSNPSLHAFIPHWNK